jgi:exodeoxyribonuclease-1
MRHLELLKQHHADFAGKVAEAVERMDQSRAKEQFSLVDNQLTVDGRLYEGFVSDADKSTMRAVRAADPEKLSGLAQKFRDQRLQSLLPLYKARNFPQALSSDERAAWDDFCQQKLMAGGRDGRLAAYFQRLQELAATNPTGERQYLLEELQLYGESIVQTDAP